MGYASLRECVDDLERTGQLVRLDVAVDPHLEVAEIQRRVFRSGGPAVLFTRVKGCAFPLLGNLFGTRARADYIFRDALEGVRALVDAKADPAALLHRWGRALRLPMAAAHLRPRAVRASSAPVLERAGRLADLPPLVSWPRDGGPFITLPQVYTEDPAAPGVARSNLGMYRVQLSGNAYAPEREVGLHYQIHRGIGVHHAEAIRRGAPLPVRVFVGGPPSMTLAAVMPLPEGLPEVAFAGALNGRAVRLVRMESGPALHADADFCISGYVLPRETKPEGPFGDHLGYYAGVHEFPVLHVESVHHRKDAIWPFTTVGRPPQEDTVFGDLIHELTGPLVPTVLPGVRAVHAVDACGVHPLLLAVGSERYVPYATERRPMEVLTQAHAILGQGQMALAKYVLIAAREDDETLDVRDVGAFFRHVLERFSPERDLHFVTHTTMDTLDYSGTGLNAGSKLVLAAVGPRRRTLGHAPPEVPWPRAFGDPQVPLPGVLVVRAPPHGTEPAALGRFAGSFLAAGPLAPFPLVVLVDDPRRAARTVEDWLWTTFTRSDPAVDIDGVEAFVEHKAWGCRGSVVVDGRAKAHHQATLEEDPAVTARVDALAGGAGPLARWLRG